MPDSFFQKPKASKGSSSSRPSNSSTRKRPGPSSSKPKPPKKARREEDLSSDDDGEKEAVDDMDFRRDTRGGEDSDEERKRDKLESAAEKRLRLAKGYLGKLAGAAEDDDTFDALEIDRETMNARLQQDMAAHSPKIHIFISQLLAPIFPTYFLPIPTHAPTSAIYSPNTPYIYTSTKSGAIYTHSSTTGKLTTHYPSVRPSTLSKAEKKAIKKAKKSEQGGWVNREEPKGHTGEVLDLALSEDGKILASAGGKDSLVGVWDVGSEGTGWKKGVRGHRSGITSVTFRHPPNPSYTLLTTSLDRTVALFSLSTLTLQETLFGHLDSAPSLSTLRGSSAVSVGGRDRTARFWKIEEEGQLVFRGGGASKIWDDVDDVDEEKEGDSKATAQGFREGSLDAVAMIDESHFVVGGDSGTISLFSILKKKPIFTMPLAHGVSITNSDTEGPLKVPRWITSLACVPYGDTFASGSWDGKIRIWALDKGLKKFSLVREVPAKGFVNSIKISSAERSMVDFSRWRQHEAEAPVENGHAKHEDEDGKEFILAAALGKDMRLGRWVSLKGNKDGEGARNGVLLVHLKLKEGGQEGEEKRLDDDEE